MALADLGPYPTIASLSLGTPRKFRLRAVPSKDPSVAQKQAEARTYDIPMEHNTVRPFLSIQSSATIEPEANSLDGLNIFSS